MSNDISKHYSFTIDTKDSKTLNNGLSFNHGDDITLIIKVIEDLQPKSLTNCSVDLIIANQSQEFPIIHRYSDGGITILDDTVTIITKSNYINLIGVNVAQLLISDEDQTITTQPFAFTTISTLLSDDMVGAVDKIDTLVELDKVIEETRSKITLVDGEITRLSQMALTVKNDVESLSESLTNKVQTVITNTDSIVSGVIRDEEQRKLNENTRITSEQERARNEQARRDAEIQRNNRENTRISSENERLASERDRVSAEISRSTSEISRNSAENKRDNAETQRVTNESSRILAETDRSSAETQRVTNETSREKAETARSSAETTRLQNENSRFTAEKNRIAAETERVDNESSRKTAESNRASAETTRSNNETARSTAETKRQQSETLRVAAESDRASRFEAMNKVYEASAGEVEDNRKDYNGVVHATMYEARKTDYETLDNKFGDFTHSTYDESNIMSIKNTKDGLIKNIIVKGKTLHNLTETIQGNGSVNKQYSSIATSNLLIPGRIYTLIVKNSTNEDVSLYCNPKRLEYKGFVVSKNSTLSLTTIAVTNFNPDDATFLSLLKDQTLIQNLDVMLLEGDHTKIDIQSFQGITSIGEDGSLDIITCGKNLIDMKYIIPQTTNGVTISNDDGRIYLNGTSTGYIDIYFAGVHNTLYSRATELRRFLIGNTKTFTLSNNLNLQNFFFKSNNEYPLTTANKTVACFVRINPGKTFQNDELLVQLEEGGVSTSYESHVCDKMTIFLNEPLRRLSDTIYDEIDISNGMIIRRIGKIIFNGSEHWTISESVDRGVTSIEFVNTQHKGLSSGVCISNRFPYRLSFVDGNTSICCSEHGTYVVIKKSQLSELTPVGFTKWLADNPITLYYPLKTPIIEPIKRETLKAYDDVTTMYVDTYYKPEISADFPIDTISEIEKNRLDFNGKTHNDMYSARMSDVSYLLDTVNNSSYISYDSSDINAKNTNVGVIKDLKIKGKTLQNLAPKFDKPCWAGAGSGGLVTTCTDRTFSAQKTKEGSCLIVNTDIEGVLFKGVTYTAIFRVTSVINHKDMAFSIRYEDPMYVKICSISEPGYYTVKFTLDSSKVVTHLNFGYSGSFSETGTLTIEDLIIIMGDYTNVDVPYFQDILSVVENTQSLELISSSKNLFNYVKSDKPINNTSSVLINNGTIEVKSTQNSWASTCFVLDCKSNTTYTFSCNATKTKNEGGVYIRVYDSKTHTYSLELKNTGVMMSSGAVTMTFTTPRDLKDKYIGVQFYCSRDLGSDSTGGHWLYSDIQLEKGSQKTNFTNNTYNRNIILLNEPIRSVPNGACDELNLSTNTLTRRVYVYRITGDEKWTTWNTPVNGCYRFLCSGIIPKCRAQYEDKIFCNTLRTKASWFDKNVIFINEYTGIGVVIEENKLTELNVNGIKTWFKNNPTFIYFELATPIIEEYNYTDILKSYNDVTNISTNCGLIAPIISAKIPSNTQAIISNLMSENEELTNSISIMKATTDEKEMQNIEINLDQDLRLTMLELGVM